MFVYTKLSENKFYSRVLLINTKTSKTTDFIICSKPILKVRLFQNLIHSISVRIRGTRMCKSNNEYTVLTDNANNLIRVHIILNDFLIS